MTLLKAAIWDLGLSCTTTEHFPPLVPPSLLLEPAILDAHLHYPEA